MSSNRRDERSIQDDKKSRPQSHVAPHRTRIEADEVAQSDPFTACQPSQECKGDEIGKNGRKRCRQQGGQERLLSAAGGIRSVGDRQPRDDKRKPNEGHNQRPAPTDAVAFNPLANRCNAVRRVRHLFIEATQA